MKQKFDVITSSCIHLPLENVDTDQIIPARFLKATDKEGFGDKPKLETDASSTSVGEVSTTAATDAEGGSTADDFYGWYADQAGSYMDEDESNSKLFEKRYKAGPSIDELAEQIERLKAELGDRSPQLGGNNRRYAMRARSNRVRIYR